MGAKENASEGPVEASRGGIHGGTGLVAGFNGVARECSQSWNQREDVDG